MKGSASMGIKLDWLQKQFPSVTGLAPLDKGGQKEVFTGLHPTDGSVVLKLFSESANPERAMREVQAVVTVKCPRVPTIFGVGTVDSPVGKLIWLRELKLEGESLRARIKKGALDGPSVMRLGLHILEALTAAEKCRIVHRDVKPANIFVDTAGNYWLLDFGLARHLDKDSLTATGARFGVGTVGYSPAEQFRNKKDDIDGRSDLFALGITLYEAVQGEHPFRNGCRDQAELLRKIENEPVPKITASVGSSDFVDLIHSMTRNRRDHRPPTSAEALIWMQEICSKHGIS
jgi:serine/threonine protein kinase